ncbi:MAG TPA: hypothetical protein VJV23_11750 [Candidatus Polarisedimenticolia bacterium]|nr:hypothetical protein [Candidatus Polarisedimenticolia bacterium]
MGPPSSPPRWRGRAASLAPAACLAALLAAAPALAAAAPADPPDPSRQPRVLTPEEYLRKADELIADDHFDASATAHFKVKTDDPRFVPKAAADFLESFREAFDSFWTGRIELKPYEGVSRIYLFYSRFKYKQLLPEAEEGLESIGHYREGYDTVALHTDSVGLPYLPDLLVHEAAHQLVSKRLYEGSYGPSLWVGEGLASYFGFMERTLKGDFAAGSIGGKNVWLFKPPARQAKGLGGEVLGRYVASLRRKEALPVERVMEIRDQAEFYGGDKAADHYAASWLLVHFLLHGRDGALAEPFARYLRHEIETGGDVDDFYRILGMEPAALQSAFEAYVRRL